MPVESQLKEVAPCVHRWLIATPSGPTSEGTCRLCGATDTFWNGERERGNYIQREKAAKKLKFNGKGLVGRVIA